MGEGLIHLTPIESTSPLSSPQCLAISQLPGDKLSTPPVMTGVTGVFKTAGRGNLFPYLTSSGFWLKTIRLTITLSHAVSAPAWFSEAQTVVFKYSDQKYSIKEP